MDFAPSRRRSLWFFTAHGLFSGKDVRYSFFRIEADGEIEEAGGLDLANQGRFPFTDFRHVGTELEGGVMLHRLCTWLATFI